LITSVQATKKFGDPASNEAKFMQLYDIPSQLLLPTLPKRVYGNALLIPKLQLALHHIKEEGAGEYIKTWDGCFNIRNKKLSSSASMHSWGLAVDINAAWNKMGNVPTINHRLVDCFKKAGFDWGGDWSAKYCDGMHFQLAVI